MLKDILESSKKNLGEKIVPVLLISIIALAFLVGVLWEKVSNSGKGGVTATPAAVANANAGAANPNVTLDTIKGLFGKDLIKMGDANSKVLFVEISDPSCPYCQAATGQNPKLNREIDTTNNAFKLISDGGKYDPPVVEMKKLVDAGKASFVYIYSPGHGNGEMGMKALYCANEKGKFWEANDLLMSDAGYT